MERAAFYAALATKKLKGLCLCVAAVYGNASTRMSEIVPSRRHLRLWRLSRHRRAVQAAAAARTTPRSASAMLHEIQKTLHERTRFAPIYDYFWPSGVGPRVEDPALMKIDPFPWSAPLEDVRLKQN